MTPGEVPAVPATAVDCFSPPRQRGSCKKKKRVAAVKLSALTKLCQSDTRSRRLQSAGCDACATPFRDVKDERGEEGEGGRDWIKLCVAAHCREVIRDKH